MKYYTEISVPAYSLQLHEIFTRAGFELYLVGGAVRDAVAGTVPKDFDFATNAHPTDVVRLLTEEGISANQIGAAFGVVAAHIDNNLVEIATFREDITAGRHPTVRFSTIEHDIARRDFTANALFYDIAKRCIVDLTGGVHDIKSGILRCVGEPQARFAEDRLRIMRAFRIANKYGWNFSPDLSRAIIRDPNLVGVSPERIHGEFTNSLMTTVSVNRLLRSLAVHGVLEQMFPGLILSVDDVCRLDTRYIPRILSVLLRENEIHTREQALHALKYSCSEVKATEVLISLRDLSCETAYVLRKRSRQAAIPTSELYDACLSDLCLEPALVRAFIDTAPSVTGEELLALGFVGKELGIEQLKREAEAFKRLLESYR